MLNKDKQELKEDVEILQKELIPKLHRTWRNPLENVLKEVNSKTCEYKQQVEGQWICNKCEEEVFWNDGDIELDISYCPFCGSKIVKNTPYSWEE